MAWEDPRTGRDFLGRCVHICSESLRRKSTQINKLDIISHLMAQNSSNGYNQRTITTLMLCAAVVFGCGSSQHTQLHHPLLETRSRFPSAEISSLVSTTRAGSILRFRDATRGLNPRLVFYGERGVYGLISPNQLLAVRRKELQTDFVFPHRIVTDLSGFLVDEPVSANLTENAAYFLTSDRRVYVIFPYGNAENLGFGPLPCDVSLAHLKVMADELLIYPVTCNDTSNRMINRMIKLHLPDGSISIRRIGFFD